ncbi:accessory Sec system translocase SecA2 [Microbacterium sp.]|uniref:accessory Sec system translocase SecA2 n=1 Tax=Microbacterium sp. TaxID=51671 RepID=UPI003A941ECD
MKRWLAQTLGEAGTVSFEPLRARVADARALEAWATALSDADLRPAARAAIDREGHGTARAAGAGLLAVLSTAAERALGQRPFDEQLLACCALLSGNAVELDTGEGKTLAGALAATAFAVAGRQVHVLSVNDYLARRDAEWMRPVYDLLGVSSGWLGQHTPGAGRRELYRGDILHAPVSEVGYDVLRDRFVMAVADRVAARPDVAIVDEADAVMIDEAMAPLVLAGSSSIAPDGVALADMLVRELRAGEHYAVDDDRATVSLTDAGIDALERRLGGVNLYDVVQAETLTRINLALHAHVLIVRDVDYLVQDGAITLINAARGRVAEHQRWPDGLQAALEAKEELPLSSPGTVLDSLTVQDLLRRYPTLVGMSGTILPVADELAEFYELPSGRVERHLPDRRIDLAQRVLPDDAARLSAVIDEVRLRHRTGQPVLVGTQSVAESERVAAALGNLDVAVRVLNARNDAAEASIIAAAGEFGAVTISTQMSGRGTDIRLGGADEHDHARVAGLGGLVVVQVGRYPSRRLDAQLRGRAGRQGDPGTTVTFVSVQDDLVQAHAPAHLLAEIARHGPGLDAARLDAIVDQAQRIAEGVRRDRHRDTWDFTRAIARQRHTVLAERGEVLDGQHVHEQLTARIPAKLAELEAALSPEIVARAGRDVVLWCLDEHWCDHLAMLSELRDGIHLQALAGLNPRDEFHRIALRRFDGFFARAYDQAADVLRRATPEQVASGLTQLGLRRPSATWTYMVRENPLGGSLSRAARTAGRWFRSRVLGIE